MAGTQISTSVTIISSLLGYQALSLTNLTTSAESQIAAGSKVEIASAFFTFASDEQPSGWSSITTAATAYITLTPSGTAGSQIVSAAYTETAPEWSDSKQGWYASAASSTRYVGKVTKTSATQWEQAHVLAPIQDNTADAVSTGLGEVRLRAKVIDIGDWNMDSTVSVHVAHGLTLAQIRSVSAMIRNDAGTEYYLVPMVTPTPTVELRFGYTGGSNVAVDATNVDLVRVNGGVFDSSDFDSTSYNRGWVTVWYEA